MANRLSTGLVNKMLATGPFKATMALGFIDVYTGSQPATADVVPTGTKLCTLFSDGASTGLSLEAGATDGVISKLASQTWSGTILADGTAGWFRFRAVGDTGVLSYTEARYDGACATSGAELNLSTLGLVTGAVLTVSAATFTLPMA